ncbi:MAG TPA: glycosyltransferase, partial [Candidatus Binatia bacterium]
MTNFAPPSITVIIPTKNRCEMVEDLLTSLEKVRDLMRIKPNIIVGDNVSTDSTWKMLETRKTNFPTELIPLSVSSPGK